MNYLAAGPAVVVVVLDKIPIHDDEHEDEYEKSQIRSFDPVIWPCRQTLSLDPEALEGRSSKGGCRRVEFLPSICPRIKKLQK